MLRLISIWMSVLGLAGWITAAKAQDSVEVLHWWTSGSEAKALQVLKDDLEGQGVTWQDMPVPGGSGEAAMTVLRARVNAHNAPSAVQMQAFNVLDWAKEGVLVSLDEVALKGGWEQAIPQAVKDFSKYEGHWIAAPVNIHSTNWIWVDKRAFDLAGGVEPQTFDELIKMLDHFRGQGLVPVAAGGQAWQDTTLFDAVALSFGDDFYRKAFIELDEETLGSDVMHQVFERMSVLRGYVDHNFSGRDWNLATAMVIERQAGAQFMGDWAKGEFLAANKRPGVDFLCFRFPGTQGAVSFLSDQMVMFKQADGQTSAQMKMAEGIESAPFQTAFSIVKGSVPATINVSDEGFDDCGKKAIADLKEAIANDRLLGSIAHGFAAPVAVKTAIFDVVTRHFNGEINATQAVAELVRGVESAK